MNMTSAGTARRVLSGLFVIAVAVSLTTAGCASVKEINADWDTAADFSAFKTFAFSDEGLPFINEKAGVAVRELVAAELGIKGYRQVEAGDADFLLVLFPGQKDGLRVDWYSMGYMPWWGLWGGGIGVGARTTDIKIGSMMVDIVDAKKMRMVWRGSIDIELKDDVSRSIDRISGSIEDLFRHFPPQ